MRQVREISGGGAYGSQNSLWAHFGLGSANQISLLKVLWPSGIIQEMKEPPVDTFLTLNEPSKLAEARVEEGIFKAGIHGKSGLNYLIETSTDLISWKPFDSTSTSAEITDSVATAGARFYRMREP